MEKDMCPCPKKQCPNNGICEKCVLKHKATDSLPFCLFPSKDKSNKEYYKHLKARFENAEQI